MAAPHQGQGPDSPVFGHHPAYGDPAFRGVGAGTPALNGSGPAQRTLRVPALQGVEGAIKVPAVKPYFWVVKLLTTAMGEAVSDYLVNDVNKYLAVVVGFVVFAIAITWQFRTRVYKTWPYWSAVAMVAVFGTMCADVMHIVLGLPYLVSAVFYAVCLTVTFVVWHRTEGTLDIHSIVTPRREVFYWLAVIFTFAMGTALGDLFATTFHLGYLASAFVFTALICVPLIAWRLGANPVLTFWVAYVLTRPIGASFADFFGMPKNISGAGYGHGAVSVVTLVLVVASFIYLSRSGIDQPETEAPAGSRSPRHAALPEPRVGGMSFGGRSNITSTMMRFTPGVFGSRDLSNPAYLMGDRRALLSAGCSTRRSTTMLRPATLTFVPGVFARRTPGSLTVVSSVAHR